LSARGIRNMVWKSTILKRALGMPVPPTVSLPSYPK